MEARAPTPALDVRIDVVPPAAAPGYLERRLPVGLILGAFVVLTLPLSLLKLAGVLEPVGQGRVEMWYVWLVGATHFFITGTVYLQAENRRYFTATARRRLVYVGVPLLVFAFFDGFGAMRGAARFPLFALGLLAAVRGLDFLHFTRQSFGVLQLLKTRAGVRSPAWAKTAEKYQAAFTALLLWESFVAGGGFAASPLALVTAAAAVACLLVVLAGFAQAWRVGATPGRLAVPLVYLGFQSASAALATWSIPLYAFCLATHYVEYHVLMMPRCLRTPLDARAWPDRLFGALRRKPLVFYAVLAGISGWFVFGAGGGRGGAGSYAALVHLFDGIFVFHYFIEAFIWKLGDPFYRRALVPLYF